MCIRDRIGFIFGAVGLDHGSVDGVDVGGIHAHNSISNDGVDAVSYTHLDVYKRQVLRQGVEQGVVHLGLVLRDGKGDEDEDKDNHDGCLLYTSRCV